MAYGVSWRLPYSGEFQNKRFETLKDARRFATSIRKQGRKATVKKLKNPRRKISKGALSKILDSTWRSAKVRVHKGEAQIALYGREAQKILKKLTGAKNPRKKRRRK